MAPDTTSIGILVFEDVEELDAIGPYEVFGVWAQAFPEQGVVLRTLSHDGRPVRCAKGLEVVPHTAARDAGRLDVLVHPGGLGTRAQLADQAHLEWLRAQRAEVPLLVSVCTGSLVLAAAGLLTGRPATTHWASLDALGKLDATIDVRGDERFVDDGDVVTSAGISAGIDVSLHLVARLGGVEQARTVRRRLQYDPAPPV